MRGKERDGGLNSPPGLWKSHAVSVSMQMETLEFCKKGGDVKKECKCEEKEEVLLSRKREVLLNVLLSHTIQEVNLLLCVCMCAFASRE